MKTRIVCSGSAKVFVVAFVLLLVSAAAQAATLTVTNTADGGAGSLRQTIISAAAGDTIVFDSTVFASAQTINLTSGELAIAKNLIINGTGARRLTVQRISGSATNFRIFNISTGTVSISGMTISNGLDSGGGNGVINIGGTLTLNAVAVSGNSGGGTGAVRNSSGTTTILNSTVSNNLNNAGIGGVAVSGGTVNIANSTISGNSGTGVGGIGVSVGALLNMNNVTVTNNTTPSTNTTSASGGVTTLSGATTNIRNTIISGNFATGGVAGLSPDARGAFTSNGNNLIGNDTGATGFSAGSNDKLNVSANLAALVNNGGQTDTHRANTGSPTINAGNACVVAASCPANNPPVALSADQRGTGFARQQGAGVDIGAIESSGTTAAGVLISGRVLTPAGRGLARALVTLTDSAGNSRTVLTSFLGYYRFTDVASGEVVVINVASKHYSFAPQILSVAEEVENLNFTAQ